MGAERKSRRLTRIAESDKIIIIGGQRPMKFFAVLMFTFADIGTSQRARRVP